jgi:hypothetical protein
MDGYDALGRIFRALRRKLPLDLRSARATVMSKTSQATQLEEVLLFSCLYCTAPITRLFQTGSAELILFNFKLSSL